ncbi:MAG TPA: phosphocholine cytidylyltransferase family protein [Candidatus Dadabacteria bacterium]|nr:phosphocholine cytidylyltransferase family protein [Candidatus Dadabacteria bacterium]
MRALILAAGEGSRLRPLTENKPKALVELCNKSLLERQVATLKIAGISDIAIATGYRGEQIQKLGFDCYHNPDYASTNMVNSLFNALPFLEKKGDLIVSYGDIVYQLDNLEKIITSDAAVSVMIDKQWLKYWQLRFIDPLSDAESLILNDDCTIKELGLKTQNYNDIQGQYIGLIKVRGDKLTALINFYQDLARQKLSNIKDFNNMYLTDFIQLLINANWDVGATCVNGGWLEVDSLEDLNLYEELAKDKKLDSYCKLEK